MGAFISREGEGCTYRTDRDLDYADPYLPLRVVAQDLCGTSPTQETCATVDRTRKRERRSHRYIVGACLALTDLCRDYAAPTRQYKLNHTDQESICPEKT